MFWLRPARRRGLSARSPSRSDLRSAYALALCIKDVPWVCALIQRPLRRFESTEIEPVLNEQVFFFYNSIRRDIIREKIDTEEENRWDIHEEAAEKKEGWGLAGSPA